MAERVPPARRRHAPPPPSLARRILPGALAVGALLIAGLLAAWFMRPSTLDRGSAPASTATAGSSAKTPRELPASFDGRAVVRKEPGTVDLCGVGALTVQPGAELYPQHVQQRADQLLQRALAQAATQSGTSPALRAAALYAGPALDRERPAEPDEACQRNPSCLQAAEQAAAQAYATGVRRLVQTATASRDGTAYGLGWMACQKSVGGPAVVECQALNAGQWAQLDADNLVAAVAAAREAEQRGDAAGFDAALARASRATQSRWPVDALLALGNLPELRAAEPAVRLAAAGRLQDLHASAPIPLSLPNPEFCSDHTLRDPGRRSACAAIAENLARSGTTLLDLMIVEALGRRLGWPEARLQALRDERDALRQVAAAVPADLWTCEAEKRLGKLQTTWGERGELAALRELQAASGQSTADLAARWRANRPPGTSNR